MAYNELHYPQISSALEAKKRELQEREKARRQQISVQVKTISAQNYVTCTKQEILFVVYTSVLMSIMLYAYSYIRTYTVMWCNVVVCVV